MRIEKLGRQPRKSDKPRIMVVYQYIALYRFPLFKLLAQSKEFEFFFAAGTTSKGQTPRYATESELDEVEFPWFHLKNRWLPANFLWQSGIRSVASRDVDGVIFLGDIHYISTWLGLIYCKLIGKPAFLWTIGMHRPEGQIKLTVRRAFFSLAQHIFVYGEYARGLMRDAGVPSGKMTTIANSLDFEAQQQLYEAISESDLWQKEQGRFNLISIGRLTGRRRLDLLIEALAQLASEGRNVHLSIIGDGPEKASLERLANRLAVVDRISFLGPIYEEEAIARFAYRSDLCVVPGVIGLGAVHAHGYGLPVVTCGDLAIQAPEAEIIVPGETGAFCPWGDLASLTTVIREWIDAGREREEVRAACLAAVERKWTPAKQRELFENILKNFYNSKN